MRGRTPVREGAVAALSPPRRDHRPVRRPQQALAAGIAGVVALCLLGAGYALNRRVEDGYSDPQLVCDTDTGLRTLTP